MSRATILVIDWTDAAHQEGPLKAYEATGLIQLRTVGWLVKEDKVSITVAQERCDEDGRFRDLESIPRVNIRKVRRFKA